ncbi:MAG: hypothetical protein HZB32_07015 [Nitrospirae bacterium]|nr:hypothetical protein [Nitrospirota bacterium]
MAVLKEVTIETIKRFVAQVFEGLKDAEEGRLLTTEELLNRVEQWGK